MQMDVQYVMKNMSLLSHSSAEWGKFLYASLRFVFKMWFFFVMVRCKLHERDLQTSSSCIYTENGYNQIYLHLYWIFSTGRFPFNAFSLLNFYTVGQNIITPANLSGIKKWQFETHWTPVRGPRGQPPLRINGAFYLQSGIKIEGKYMFTCIISSVFEPEPGYPGCVPLS